MTHRLPALPSKLARAARSVAGSVARVAAIVVAVAVAIAVGSGLAHAASSDPEPGAIRVGTSGDYPPFSLAGAGFDVDLAKRMTADLGLDVVWVPFRWPELEAHVRAGDFDVAMSGVTWRPGRAVTGFMTRAVAVGGPCVLGGAAPARVGVNRGGILERWARERFGARVDPVDDNTSLPMRLARGDFDAIVTDRFEVGHFRAQAQAALGGAPVAQRCEPAVDRKVYWVAPVAAGLGPRIDAWLGAHDAAVDDLRAQWLGGSAPRSDVDHLLDLLARRLAFMPAVARAKRSRGLAIEDPAREARVLEASGRAAAAGGLDPDTATELFRLQIELAKQVQARTDAASSEAPLDLEREIRPVLLRLGERIVAALSAVAPIAPEALAQADWVPLLAALGSEPDTDVQQRLREALLAVRPQAARP